MVEEIAERTHVRVLREMGRGFKHQKGKRRREDEEEEEEIRVLEGSKSEV